MLATFIGNVHPMLPAVHKHRLLPRKDVMYIARSVFWLASTHVRVGSGKLQGGNI